MHAYILTQACLLIFTFTFMCMFMFMQALLANMASLYGVYHGPEGLTRIADR